MSLCHRIDAQPLAGMIIVGDGQAARAIALAGNSMKIPVLWAKGGTANLQDGNREVSLRNYFFFSLDPTENISQNARWKYNYYADFNIYLNELLFFLCFVSEPITRFYTPFS